VGLKGGVGSTPLNSLHIHGGKVGDFLIAIKLRKSSPLLLGEGLGVRVKGV